MANKKYGILLTAKDEASKAVQKLSGAMGASTKAVKQLGAMGATAFKGIGASIVVANQAMELGKKAFGAVAGAVSSVMDSFKELRGESNPLVRQLDALQTRFSSLKASLGTAFTSAIVAIGKAFDPIISASLKFLENNRKLIATKIVQFIFKLATALNEGVATAAGIANDAWATFNTTIDKAVITITNWLGAWSETMLALEFSEKKQAMLQKRIENLADANHKAKQRIEATGKAHGEFADKVETTKQAIQKLIDQGYKPAMAAAKVFAEAAGATPIESAGQALNRLRDQAFGLMPALDGVSAKLTKGLGLEEGRVAFEEFERRFDRINRQLGVAGPKSIGVVKAELEKLYADFGVPLNIDIDTENVEMATEALRIFADQAEVSLLDAKEAFMILNDQIDINKRKLEEAAAKQKELADKAAADSKAMSEAWGAAAGSFSTSMISAFAAGEDAGEIFKQTIMDGLTQIIGSVIEAAVIQITSNSAVAATEGAKATAGIPIIGPVLAVAAAASMMALVAAFSKDVPSKKKFHAGGIVPGAGDTDTVPGLLTPGELIIPKDMTKRLLSLAGQPQPAANQFARGGIVRDAPAGGIVINFSEESMVQRTPAEQDKWIKEKLVPSLQRLKRKGVMV